MSGSAVLSNRPPKLLNKVENVMCRRTLTVGWDGRLYNCNFNQKLALSGNSDAPNIYP